MVNPCKSCLDINIPGFQVVFWVPCFPFSNTQVLAPSSGGRKSAKSSASSWPRGYDLPPEKPSFFKAK